MLQASRGVIEVLFYTVARLCPLDGSTHDNLYCRIISTLSHQNMVLDVDYLHASQSSTLAPHLARTSNTAGVMRPNLADRLLHFFVTLACHFESNMRQAQVRKSQVVDGQTRATGASHNCTNNSSVNGDSLLHDRQLSPAVQSDLTQVNGGADPSDVNSVGSGPPMRGHFRMCDNSEGSESGVDTDSGGSEGSGQRM